MPISLSPQKPRARREGLRAQCAKLVSKERARSGRGGLDPPHPTPVEGVEGGRWAALPFGIREEGGRFLPQGQLRRHAIGP